jgi:hypothetical protein
LLLEKDVVILVALERRVKVDEIDRLVPHIAAEHVEVVAVVEGVHGAPPDSTSKKDRGTEGAAADHRLEPREPGDLRPPGTVSPDGTRMLA